MLCPYSLLGKSPRAQAYGRWIADWPGLVGRLDCGAGVDGMLDRCAGMAGMVEPGWAGVAGVAGSAALALRSAIWVTQPRPCAARRSATLSLADAQLAWPTSSA